MHSNELRKLFLDYFAGKNHSITPSASLIPEDPSLLFTVAGMVPFKNYFLGKATLDFKRAASVQKCIRTNDIENVGRTRRHHTFFEMLGNFSFGDYFKDEAIEWAWDFLVNSVKLPKSRMYITIYKDDDEAYEIWTKKIKIPADRIFRLGKETNFWEMAATGPCGYCSEIYFDLEGGEKKKVAAKDIEENDDRFLEIWNLVFTQFDKKEDGTLTELERKNIDTGMGLERLAAVSQAVYSNFETDLFMPVIKYVADKADVPYGSAEKTDVSLRVIADHARGITFLIGDGVIPSNEGRGYVLRRIIRRAIRHGRLLGFKGLFLSGVMPVAARMMEEAYPEIAQRKEYITQIIKMEEEKFQETMDKGIEMLNKEIKALEKKKAEELPGEAAFKLYDTFGFPVEITAEILDEKNISIDMKKFEELMEKQRETAKKAWKGMNPEITARVPGKTIEKIKVTGFRGYEAMESEGEILAIIINKKRVKKAAAKEEADIILSATPFYAESGGQVGDAGSIKTEGAVADVSDTQKTEGIYIHRVKILRGELFEGDRVIAQVDPERRKAIMKNHTATHLLHAALRKILGNHVEQAGSYVGEDRLRFDFTHFAQINDRELGKIERLVNKWIQNASGLKVEEMEFEKAKKMGAMALFEEKYKEKVRTVSVPDISMELCAGTHTENTGEIGLFKIAATGSVAAGIRRIEAVTGMSALELVAAHDGFIKEMKNKFKASDIKGLNEKINRLVSDYKDKEKEVQQAKRAEILTDAGKYVEKAKKINGINLIALEFNGADKNGVRELGDIIKAKTKNTVAVIANRQKDRVGFLAIVTDDLTDRLDASAILKKVAAVCKGGGGGRKDMAEAGGKDPSKIKEALKQAEKELEG